MSSSQDIHGRMVMPLHFLSSIGVIIGKLSMFHTAVSLEHGDNRIGMLPDQHEPPVLDPAAITRRPAVSSVPLAVPVLQPPAS